MLFKLKKCIIIKELGKNHPTVLDFDSEDEVNKFIEDRKDKICSKSETYIQVPVDESTLTLEDKVEVLWNKFMGR